MSELKLHESHQVQLPSGNPKEVPERMVPLHIFKAKIYNRQSVCEIKLLKKSRGMYVFLHVWRHIGAYVHVHMCMHIAMDKCMN